MAKYDPLREMLRADGRRVVTLSFAEIQMGIGGSLPRSAREHRAWWSNEVGGNHVQAHAWMEAKYRVDDVDLMGGTVRFVRDA